MDPHPARLAVYGSLVPGGPNHHVLEGITGTWSRGNVRGHLHPTGWGADLGYPALRPDPGGERVPVWVLASDELVERWPELDRFEGAEYERVVVPVELDGEGTVSAQLYAARGGESGGHAP